MPNDLPNIAANNPRHHTMAQKAINARYNVNNKPKSSKKPRNYNHDLVILDTIRLYALLTRLSMDMLIHAGESIMRRAGNEELTKIKPRQEANPASILLY